MVFGVLHSALGEEERSRRIQGATGVSRERQGIEDRRLSAFGPFGSATMFIFILFLLFFCRSQEQSGFSARSQLAAAATTSLCLASLMFLRRAFASHIYYLKVFEIGATGKVITAGTVAPAAG